MRVRWSVRGRAPIRTGTIDDIEPEYVACDNAAVQTSTTTDLFDRLLRAPRRAGLRIPPPQALAPLAETLAYWLESPRHLSGLVPSAGGIVLSSRIEGDEFGPLRVDCEPIWQADNPRAVYNIATDLAASTGRPRAAAHLHRLLNAGAWSQPGGGAVPFLGVGAIPDGGADVRAWTPTIWPAQQPPVQLPTTPEPLAMAGVQVRDGEIVKFSAYMPSAATSLAALLARAQIADSVFGSRARLRIVDQALAADADAYRGFAFRTTNGSTWESIVEVEVTHCDQDIVPRWALQTLSREAAKRLEAMISDGLHPCFVAIGPSAATAPFVAVYFSPTPPHQRPPRFRFPSASTPLNVPGAAGEIAQSVVASDGTVTTARWRP
jgi:hypothetical protein